MHKEALLDIVLDQIQQDLKDGYTSSLLELLEEIDNATLVGFLSPLRYEAALEEGLINE
tara:strand:+ start:416 stop:592 length:177 start_codon:yes stop_codon:yes gene_type:complete